MLLVDYPFFHPNPEINFIQIQKLFIAKIGSHGAVFWENIARKLLAGKKL